MKHLPLLLVATASLLPAQVDRVVGPGGYATFVAAFLAANNGDRILLAQSVTLPYDWSWQTQGISKALTIEAAPGLGRVSFELGDGWDGRHKVLAVASPTTLRNISFKWGSVDGPSFAPGRVHLGGTGNVVLENVDFDEVSVNAPFSDWGPFPPLLLIHTTGDVILRNVDIECPRGGEDGQDPYGALAPYRCASVTARALVAEDCTLIGGDAWRTHLNRAPISQYPGYAGCAGLEATTQVVTLNRCVIVDGNGGANMFLDAPNPPIIYTSAPGVSTFGASATLNDSVWIKGIAGNAGGPRLPPERLGPAFPPTLTISSARLGGTMSVHVAGGLPTAAGLLLGLALDPIATPFGTLVPRPDIGIATPSGSALITFPVPALPELVDATLVGQVVEVAGGVPVLGAVSIGLVGR